MRTPIPILFKDQQVKELATAIRELSSGRTNASGSVTLTLSSTTTVVSDPLVSSSSAIFLSPTNAAAAAESPYISSVGDETFTITHASAGTTRTFDYLVATKDPR